MPRYRNEENVYHHPSSHHSRPSNRDYCSSRDPYYSQYYNERQTHWDLPSRSTYEFNFTSGPSYTIPRDFERDVHMQHGNWYQSDNSCQHPPPPPPYGSNPFSQHPWSVGMYSYSKCYDDLSARHMRIWNRNPAYPTYPRPPPRESAQKSPDSNEENHASKSKLKSKSSPQITARYDLDFEMVQLPFFRMVSLLTKFKTNGSAQATFCFTLRESEIKLLRTPQNTEKYQVQVRVCQPNSSEEQKDFFPSSLIIQVNKRLLPLPGLHTIPRGPAGPIDITHLCSVSSPGNNSITVVNGKQLAVQVSLVERQGTEHLLQIIQHRGLTSPDDTALKIREKLEASEVGDEIASTTQRCSLLCPLSKARMTLPCRASTCHHFQCFDVNSYLQMNELNPKWLCPVCFQRAEFKDLQIDGYFKEILDQNAMCDMVILTASGNWESLQEKEKQKKKKKEKGQELQHAKLKESPEALGMEAAVRSSPLTSHLSQTIVLDSDSEEPPTTTPSHDKSSFYEGNVSLGAEKSVETITLSGDESCTTPSNFSFQSMSCSTPIRARSKPGNRKRSRLNSTPTPQVTSTNSHVSKQPVNVTESQGKRTSRHSMVLRSTKRRKIN